MTTLVGSEKVVVPVAVTSEPSRLVELIVSTGLTLSFIWEADEMLSLRQSPNCSEVSWLLYLSVSLRRKIEW